MTRSNFIEALKSLASTLKLQGNSYYKSFFCIIMAHGEPQRGFYCHDQEVVTVKEVLEEFKDVIGIPKVLVTSITIILSKRETSGRQMLFQIFLCNACRGIQEKRVQYDAVSSSHTEDCFLWFGCEDNFVSYRHPNHGSPFIKEFSRVR